MKRVPSVLLCLLGVFIESSAANDSVLEEPITANDREHWAFRPLSTAPLPSVKGLHWIRTPADAYILAKLESLGLTGGRDADQTALLRRITFDLTGLAPTLDEQRDFQNDPRPDAYEQLVERLLSSPSYGERWAQHWLDLARFADTDGFEHDKIRPDAWKYRDWVIAALNRDLPYDEFVRQQLAGDELPDGDAIATMFGLAGPDMPDVNDQTERRHFRLNDLTATVGSVFLGLQLGCAECHDHKYDPISQTDFYRLRAVFESAMPVLKRDQPYYQLAQQKDVEPARLWIRGDFRRPGAMVEPGLPRIAAFAAIPLGRLSSPHQRTALAEVLVNEARPLTARVIVNRLWQHHFGRSLAASASDFGVINSDPSHPELLDWLANDLIEHDWSLKHLHRRIVLSSAYRQASRRAEAADTEWDRRLKLDPENRLLSRSPRRRLEGEALRDALLQVSETLNRTGGGPGVQPPLPEELVNTLLKGQWTTSPNPGDHARRSIYLFARRNLRYPLLEAFDRPEANASCAARGRSTTAPQSLQLINSDLSVTTARQVVGRILSEFPEIAEQINRVYRVILNRNPGKDEQGDFTRFLTTQSAAIRDGSLQSAGLQPIPMVTSLDAALGAAWVDACLALLNSNEFLYCD